MKQPLTPKQEAFVNHVVAGLPYSQAYEMAYKPSDSNRTSQRGWDLSRNPNITSAIAERKQIIKEGLMSQLIEIVSEQIAALVEDARVYADTHPSASVSARKAVIDTSLKVLGFEPTIGNLKAAINLKEYLGTDDYNRLIAQAIEQPLKMEEAIHARLSNQGSPD